MLAKNKLMCFAGVCKPTVEEKRKYPLAWRRSAVWHPSFLALLQLITGSLDCTFLLTLPLKVTQFPVCDSRERSGTKVFPDSVTGPHSYIPVDLVWVIVFNNTRDEIISHTGCSLNGIWPESRKTIMCIFRWSMALWIIKILISRDNRNIKE